MTDDRGSPPENEASRLGCNPERPKDISALNGNSTTSGHRAQDIWLSRYLVHLWIDHYLGRLGPCVGHLERARSRYRRWFHSRHPAYRWGTWEQIQRCVKCIRRRRR
jgi:hypothetical protein